MGLVSWIVRGALKNIQRNIERINREDPEAENVLNNYRDSIQKSLKNVKKLLDRDPNNEIGLMAKERLKSMGHWED